MEDYVRETGLTWPVLLDSNREFERSADIAEINLGNIYQVSVFDGRGRYSRGRWDDVESSVDTALAATSWSYLQPAQVPAPAKAAWRHIEFGQYAQAASLLTPLEASQDTSVTTVAEKLSKITQAALARDIANLPENSDAWTRYRAMRQIAEKFQGFELPEDFRREGSRLHALPETQQRLGGRAVAE